MLIVRDFSHKTAIGSSTSLCANTKSEETHEVIFIMFFSKSFVLEDNSL